MEPFWTPEELELLLNSGHLQKYPKNQIIFSEGERTNDVYYINKGWINIYRMTEDGRRISVALRNKGEFIGISELFRPGRLRDCFGQALEKVEIYVIGVDDLNSVVNEHPKLLHKFLALMSDRLHAAHTTLLDFAFRQVPGRLAITLINMAEKAGNEENGKVTITIKLSQEELADIIGTSRQTVSNLLNSFKRIGCIEVKGRQIVAVNTEKLRLQFAPKLD